eukprot:g18239.t1
MCPTLLFLYFVWVPGVVAVWAFQPLVQHDATDFLKVLRTVRMMRLLRIVFFFKHFKAFQDIFQLVRGLLSSGGTLLSALGLIAFTLYVFAIIAIDLIGHQDFTGASEDVLEAQAGFQEIFPTMLTLIRFMHADDSQPILDLLTKKLPWIWVFTWLFTAMTLGWHGQVGEDSDDIRISGDHEVPKSINHGPLTSKICLCVSEFGDGDHRAAGLGDGQW